MWFPNRLFSQRGWLEAGKVGFRKKMKCSIGVAKTKALPCAFVFANEKCWFPDDSAHMISSLYSIIP